jgi:hypothetical protein
MIRLLLSAAFFVFCLTGVFGQEYEVDTTYTMPAEPAFDTYERETDESSEPTSESDEYDSYDSDEETITHVTLEPDAINSTRQYQSKKLEVRKFDKEEWKKVVADKDYKEDKPEEEEKEPEKEEEAREMDTPVSPWGGPAFRMISYLVIIGLAIFILYLVAKNVSFTRKFSKETVITDDTDGIVDDIQNLNTQTLLQQALAQGNYRLAVRLYYLELLKKLNEAGIIIWKKDKTNRDYLSEIFSRDYYYDDVRKLTLAYELVWYGERSLTQESFQRLISNFENLHQKFNTTRTP